MEARDGQPLISPSLVRVHTSISITDRSHIAIQLRQIEEHIIDYIQPMAIIACQVWVCSLVP